MSDGRRCRDIHVVAKDDYEKLSFSVYLIWTFMLSISALHQQTEQVKKGYKLCFMSFYKQTNWWRLGEAAAGPLLFGWLYGWVLRWLGVPEFRHILVNIIEGEDIVPIVLLRLVCCVVRVGARSCGITNNLDQDYTAWTVATHFEKIRQFEKKIQNAVNLGPNQRTLKKWFKVH